MKDLTTLADSHFSDKGSLKHNYTNVYDSFLAPLRSESIKLLEIGFAEGGSSAMWIEYFPEAFIYGADIFSQEALLQYYSEKPFTSSSPSSTVVARMKAVFNHERFTFLQLDQSQPLELSSIDEKFDVIIDDGSHIHGDIQLTFGILGSRLKDGGFYFMEDLNCERSFSNPGECKSPVGAHLLCRDTREVLGDFDRSGSFSSPVLTKSQNLYIEKNFSLRFLGSISSGTIACLQKVIRDERKLA